jgi:soluble lytic murein transglycosylase-like protein
MARHRYINTLTAALGLAAVTLFATGLQVQASTGKNGQQTWNTAEIKAMVRTEARNIGLPVALALAIARVESDFRPHLESHKGARGVMQIMPATALEEYAIPANMLWNPRINIRLGLHFLQRLLVRYKGRVDLALSYYNGGSRVGDLPNARVMPATRKYVNKVRTWQQKYQRQAWLGGAEWKSSKQPGTSWKRERARN